MVMNSPDSLGKKPEHAEMLNHHRTMWTAGYFWTANSRKRRVHSHITQMIIPQKSQPAKRSA